TGAGLSLLGAWLIAIIRLNMVRAFFSLDLREGVCFFLEMIFFALTLFGLFTAISALPELRARINRIDDLGERDW
ncbi:MAG: hypothetical protein SV487_03380, partial [Thermodesulfobacteriota bacterium]|nr:hypothetical protein [Thermodesulfobacteriota bacterium]